jgi:hypothetical protein
VVFLSKNYQAGRLGQSVYMFMAQLIAEDGNNKLTRAEKEIKKAIVALATQRGETGSRILYVDTIRIYGWWSGLSDDETLNY